MGLLTLFQRVSAKEICDEIANKIVRAASHYQTRLDTDNNYYAAKAGEELAFLLLHMLDRQALSLLGPIGRNHVFDAVVSRVVFRYWKCVLQGDVPAEILDKARRKMWDVINERQVLYSQCTSWIGEDPEAAWPGPGTMVFVLSFFIHQALGLTRCDDVDDMLLGKLPIETSRVDDFPEEIKGVGSL